jgi:hypothetical protein
MYFVSGSYPHAQQFYYAEGRGNLQKDPSLMTEEERLDYESTLNKKKKKKGKQKLTNKKDEEEDTMSLLPANRRSSSNLLDDSGESLRLSKHNLDALETQYDRMRLLDRTDSTIAGATTSTNLQSKLNQSNNSVISPLHSVPDMPSTRRNMPTKVNSVSTSGFFTSSTVKSPTQPTQSTSVSVPAYTAPIRDNTNQEDDDDDLDIERDAGIQKNQDASHIIGKLKRRTSLAMMEDKMRSPSLSTPPKPDPSVFLLPPNPDDTDI